MVTAVIYCKDKSRRVVRLVNTRNNQWHIHEVIKLGRDLEGDNYLSAAVIS